MTQQLGTLIDDLDAAGLWAKLAREFYAQGAFTPTLVPGTSGSYTVTSSGFWIRIGGLVYVTGSIDITGSSSPVGSLAIGGLPFTARNQSGENHLLTIGSYDFVNLTASYTEIHGLVLANTDSALIRESGDNVSAQSVVVAAVNTNTALSFSGWYEVAQ